VATVLEDSILIAPLAVISAGAHIQSAATIDTFAHLGKYVRIGEHAKVCSSCSIPDHGVVDDWVVIWGGATLQRRMRAHGRESRGGGMLGGGTVEDGRLIALNRERETLIKLIGSGAAAAKRR
jgi:carbonic anhydrase/acetyltransferase-like protein (isoleucine patch superfamily)